MILYIFQQHCPEVDCTGVDGDEPKGTAKPTRVLQKQKVPPSRPPAKEDSCDQTATDQGMQEIIRVDALY